MINFLRKKYDKRELKILHQEYLKNKPYPHIMIDGLFNNLFLSQISRTFPDLEKAEKNFVRSGGPGGPGKNGSREGCLIAKGFTKHFIRYLNSYEFVNLIQSITQIDEQLIVDHTLSGGGLHSTSKNGKLNLHIDFPKHRQNGLDRRVNVLIYLNKNWQREWEGDFVAVGKDFSAKSYLPNFNRTLIFETNDNTIHGHPSPLKCPINIKRNSIAMYYYTLGRPKEEINYPLSDSKKNSPRSTIYFEYEKLNYLEKK